MLRTNIGKAIGFILGLAILPALALSNYSTDVLAHSSIVSYWQLGETVGSGTAADSGPAGTTLTAANVTFGSTPLEGTAETSASFNGSTSGLAAASSSALNYEYTQPFFIDAIIDTTLASPAPFTAGMIFAKQDSGGNYQGYSFAIEYIGGWTLAFFMGHNLAQQINVTSGGTMTANAIHHVAVSYDGSGVAAGVKLYIDGALQTNTVNNDTLSGQTILTSSTVHLGNRSNGDSFFQGNIQYVAVYNTAHPQGVLTGVSNGDLVDTYHANLVAAQVDPAPPTLPAAGSRPNVIVDDDPASDISGMTQIAHVAWLHKRGLINLLAYIVDEKSPTSASITRVMLNYYGLSSIPILAYQGSAGTDYSSFYSTAMTAQWRPQDNTNLGILNSYSVGTGGTLNQVGDILTFQGGTLCPGGSAGKIVVTSVSSGAITGARQYAPGCYTSAPASPATLSNAHSGTAATLNISTGSDRGLYTDAASGIIDLLNANSHVWIYASGQSNNLIGWLTNDASLITSKTDGMMLSAGWGSGSSNFGNNSEYNFTQQAADWNTIVPGWPVQIIQYGIENASPDPSQVPATWTNVMGPVNLNDQKTNPLTWAFANATGQTYQSGTYLRSYWEYSDLNVLGYGVTLGGSGHALDGYYQGNKGTGSVNASTGTNAWTASAGKFSWMRRSASDSFSNTFLAEIMATSENPTIQGSRP